MTPGAPGVIDEVPAGRLYVDGGVVTAENGEALRERRHAALNGMITASLALDGRSRVVSGPRIRAIGMPGDEDYTVAEAVADLTEAARDGLARLSADDREDDDAVESAVSRALKKAAFRIWKRRPVVETTVLRL